MSQPVANRSAEVRKLLNEAPSTCDEISALLDIPLRKAQIAMWVLTSTGQAKATGNTIPSVRGAGRRRKFYELTFRGKAMLA